MPRHIPYSTTTISSLLTNCVFSILLHSCNHDTSHISTMQALPTAEWYREYPKPFAPGGRNFDIAKCCYGLCLTKSDFGTLSQFIMEAFQRSDVTLDEPSGLRCVDVKDKVNGVLKRNTLGPQVRLGMAPCLKPRLTQSQCYSRIQSWAKVPNCITVGYMSYELTQGWNTRTRLTYFSMQTPGTCTRMPVEDRAITTSPSLSNSSRMLSSTIMSRI